MSVAIDWGVLRPEFVPVVLFGLRAGGLTLSTLRMLSLIRGRALAAWVLGFFEAGIFVLGAAGLLTNLSNPWNIVAYAAGYGTGIVTGMTLERLLLPSHDLVRVYSAGRGPGITEALRRFGRGVTEVSARGLSGTVEVLYATVRRRQVRKLRRQILAIDPEAVVTIETVRSLVGGWRA
jgi:uncharacterized protein YebE (UPF0316 family)